jgi:hypothetical protein
LTASDTQQIASGVHLKTNSQPYRVSPSSLSLEMFSAMTLTSNTSSGRTTDGASTFTTHDPDVGTELEEAVCAEPDEDFEALLSEDSELEEP